MVIQTIADRLTQDVYDGINSRYSRKLPRNLHAKARRLLDLINAAPSLDVLRSPPSNNLEKLRGNWEPFWSLRINDQWRIIFLWEDGDASEVRIIDYHD